MVDLYCTCGHLDAEHFCSEKSHSKKKHRCNITDRVFCDNEDMYDPPWSCKCTRFSLDNLLYLEQLDKEYYVSDRN